MFSGVAPMNPSDVSFERKVAEEESLSLLYILCDLLYMKFKHGG